ncbi:hypothetical protein [Vulcanococcus sp.]|jgi:hypothetical protein
MGPGVIALKDFAVFAAAAGAISLVVWVTIVMLDLQHLQSGFTLP